MAVYRGGFRHCWPSRHEPEDGFTLVEVLAALVLIGTALVVMAATMYSSFGSIAFSRQRNTATALANKAMEQIRALSFTQLNMDSADFAGDSANITTHACPAGSGVTTCYGYKGRLIPAVAYPAGQHGLAPLDPHQKTDTPAPGVSTYTTSTYITYDANNDATNRVATVVVSWTKAGQGGVQASVQVESTIFASNFVGNPATNVAATTATVTPGIISVKGTVAGSQLVDLTMNLDNAMAQVGGSAGAGGATAAGGSAESKANVLGTTFADTPGATATATSPYGTGVSPSSPPASTGTISSTPWSLVTTPVSGILALTSINLTPTVWSTTKGSATAASSAQNSANVPGVPYGGPFVATIPNSQLPYAAASASTTGTAGVDLNLLGVLDMGVVTLVPTGNAAPDVATVDQEAVPTKKITATASKSFGAVNVLTLPGLLGGSPIVSLSGWQATATAVAVPGGQASIASSTSSVGTLKVLGNPVIDLSTVTGTVPIIPTIGSVSNLLGGILGPIGTVSITGNVSVGSKTSVTGTNGQATVNSPLNVQLRVVVVLLGITVVDLNVNIDLGSVTASAVYPS